MKLESRIFGYGVFFFVPVAFIYGYLTNWTEWVGTLAILLVGGVGDGGATLDGDTVVVAEAQQPLHAFAVGVDVGRCDVAGLVAPDAGEVGALEQRDLAGGPARGDGADVAGLQHSDPATRPGQQGGGDQPGQSGPHHHVVVRGVGEERISGDGGAAIQPE